MTGQFVYGIVVKEYRNGIYIGGNISGDFQVNVVPLSHHHRSVHLFADDRLRLMQADFVNTSAGERRPTLGISSDPQEDDTFRWRTFPWVYRIPANTQATLVAYSSIDPACNDTACWIGESLPAIQCRNPDTKPAMLTGLYVH